MRELFTTATFADHLTAATVSIGIIAAYLLATFIARTAAELLRKPRP
jgi:hypothetical protein